MAYGDHICGVLVSFEGVLEGFVLRRRYWLGSSPGGSLSVAAGYTVQVVYSRAQDIFLYELVIAWCVSQR